MTRCRSFNLRRFLMSQLDNMTPEQMRARIGQIEVEIELREKIARLEAKVKGGHSGGSPQAMTFREPAGRYLISPHSGPSAMDTRRVEFARAGDYEKM